MPPSPRTATQLREELIAEVGCPDMTITTAQLDWPLAEVAAVSRGTHR